MRRTKDVKIEEGRDAGKLFRITEMPAFQMDKWATRALIALGKSQKGGIVALGSMNIQDVLASFAELDYEKTEPLLQELLECCSFIKDGASIQLTKDMVDSIVEDWTTLFKLRMESLQLNLGFFGVGDGSGTK